MLKVAVVGAGTMGTLYARALSESGDATVVAVVDRDVARAKASAERVGGARVYAEVDELLDSEGDLDAVALALPDFAHAEPAIRILERGISLLSEKPLAVTLDDCLAIAAAAKSSSGRFMINYGNRQRPESIVLQRIVESGELGALIDITMKGNEKLSKTHTLAWAARTNPTLFLISHLVDYVTWTTGLRFETVFGLSPTSAPDEFPQPAATSYLGRLENGALVNLTACWTLPDASPAPGDLTIEIVGSEGEGKINFMHRPVVVNTATQAREVGWDLALELDNGTLKGWWIDSCRHFLRCVADGVDPEPGIDSALETSIVLTAMLQSLESGSPVSVSEVRSAALARLDAATHVNSVR